MVDEHARVIRLRDGRELEILYTGPDAATPLVFHHGTPFAGTLFEPLVRAAAACGLRTVTYSRPGYVRSTPQPGRSVADAAADTSAVLDALGATTFYALGWSGGGPHALACAALLPDRCLAATSLAGVAPFRADGLEWLAGMGPENVEEFSLTLEGPHALEPFLERERASLRNVQPDQVTAALGGLLSDVDKAVLTGDYADYSARTLRRSVEHGVAGWRDDDIAFARPWGFDLGSVPRPVAVWQGGEDRMVPFAHGEWLATHVSNARPRLFRDEGHLSLALGKMNEIVADLVAIAR